MRQITRTATLVGSVFMLGALAACAPQQTYPSQYPSGGYTSGGYQSNAPVYSNNAMGTEYGRDAAIDNISSIKGEDLEVTKNGDKIVVSYKYAREIPLAGPAYLVYRFQEQTK